MSLSAIDKEKQNESSYVLVTCDQSLVMSYREALAQHTPWVVVVRGSVPEHLEATLRRGSEADVILLYRRRLLARVLPEIVCWRRDTLAAALAAGTGIPTTFHLLRRAVRMGGRVLTVPLPAAKSRPAKHAWADAA
jgi:hypothetical protein